jgi:protein farnesyltransferase subunit beta
MRVKRSQGKDEERLRSQCLVDTETTESQEEAEYECKPFFINLHDLPASQVSHLRDVGLVDPQDQNRDICLVYQKHFDFLSRAFGVLSGSFTSLDASRPWMIYWSLHSCDLLGKLPPEQALSGIVHTLEACWQSLDGGHSGGFGGGPGQMAHCAPTYAAILTLCIIGTTTTNETASQLALDLIQKVKEPLSKWWIRLQETNGGFRMHFDGEIDVRASYCILCCAKLLNLISNELNSPLTLAYIQNCQTYEGGFGGEPGSEAHGGYTFCAVAALEIMGKLHEIDIPALRGWLVRRQMPFEGGFQGRSNKLVDGCYSFWQGGALAILSVLYQDTKGRDGDAWLSPPETPTDLLFDEGLLQRYILLCAQDVNGGLRDKPSKPRDFYHTCYNLSGLSVSQSCGGLVFGHPMKSKVGATHPVYNIRVDRVEAILNKFYA